MGYGVIDGRGYAKILHKDYSWWEMARKAEPKNQRYFTPRMIVANHRLEALPEVAVQFEALKNALEGAADVEIVSAFPLEGSLLDELVVGLERRFKRKLKPAVSVDASLIGGVRVTVGDEVLDTSVRAQLARMQVALTA